MGQIYSLAFAFSSLLQYSGADLHWSSVGAQTAFMPPPPPGVPRTPADGAFESRYRPLYRNQQPRQRSVVSSWPWGTTRSLRRPRAKTQAWATKHDSVGGVPRAAEKGEMGIPEAPRNSSEKGIWRDDSAVAVSSPFRRTATMRTTATPSEVFSSILPAGEIEIGVGGIRGRTSTREKDKEETTVGESSSESKSSSREDSFSPQEASRQQHRTVPHESKTVSSYLPKSLPTEEGVAEKVVVAEDSGSETNSKEEVGGEGGQAEQVVEIEHVDGKAKHGGKDVRDGYGEHGWFSMGAVDTGTGSLFSWRSEDADSGSRSSDQQSQTSPPKASTSSAPASAPAAASTPAAASASASSSGSASASASTAGSGSSSVSTSSKDNATDDNNWSQRRKLVEDWETHDEIWISMRKEAKAAAKREPLLVSFIYSTILNQNTLEAAVAFHLANKLAGPNMLSTQVQGLVRECFAEMGTPFRRQLRRDIIAVRERDPACESYHDCLLYFKGFQALQTHRVAHWLYHSGRHALAFYLQSQVNQEFQIDIHPGAKFGEGVFIDHGTGIVVGETTVVGDDVSMLHRVTLGGSGVQNSDRHPKIGNGVLIGAGACLLGNVKVGKGTQIGAGSLVVIDLPERCVAVGVPAKVLGQGRNRNPALAMGQDFFKEVWKGQDI